jgi:hypothetical protein
LECSSAYAIGAARTTIVCVASSFDWLALLSFLVILISVIVAGIGVASARKIARQRATLDMIEKVESTEHYRGIQAVFSKHRKAGSFSQLHAPSPGEQEADRRAVFDYLNHYELVSIGICKNTLDAGIYRDWMLGPFVRDWNAAAAFIQRERWKQHPDTKLWSYREPVFKNYQDVACEWSLEAVRLTEQYGGPPAEPEGPGDEPLPDAAPPSR